MNDQWDAFVAVDAATALTSPAPVVTTTTSKLGSNSSSRRRMRRRSSKGGGARRSGNTTIEAAGRMDMLAAAANSLSGDEDEVDTATTASSLMMLGVTIAAAASSGVTIAAAASSVITPMKKKGGSSSDSTAANAASLPQQHELTAAAPNDSAIPQHRPPPAARKEEQYHQSTTPKLAPDDVPTTSPSPSLLAACEDVSDLLSSGEKKKKSNSSSSIMQRVDANLAAARKRTDSLKKKSSSHRRRRRREESTTVIKASPGAIVAKQAAQDSVHVAYNDKQISSAVTVLATTPLTVAAATATTIPVPVATTTTPAKQTSTTKRGRSSCPKHKASVLETATASPNAKVETVVPTVHQRRLFDNASSSVVVRTIPSEKKSGNDDDDATRRSASGVLDTLATPPAGSTILHRSQEKKSPGLLSDSKVRILNDILSPKDSSSAPISPNPKESVAVKATTAISSCSDLASQSSANSSTDATAIVGTTTGMTTFASAQAATTDETNYVVALTSSDAGTMAAMSTYSATVQPKEDSSFVATTSGARVLPAAKATIHTSDKRLVVASATANPSGIEATTAMNTCSATTKQPKEDSSFAATTSSIRVPAAASKSPSLHPSASSTTVAKPSNPNNVRATSVKRTTMKASNLTTIQPSAKGSVVASSPKVSSIGTTTVEPMTTDSVKLQHTLKKTSSGAAAASLSPKVSSVGTTDVKTTTNKSAALQPSTKDTSSNLKVGTTVKSAMTAVPVTMQPSAERRSNAVIPSTHESAKIPSAAVKAVATELRKTGKKRRRSDPVVPPKHASQELVKNKGSVFVAANENRSDVVLPIGSVAKDSEKRVKKVATKELTTATTPINNELRGDTKRPDQSGISLNPITSDVVELAKAMNPLKQKKSVGAAVTIAPIRGKGSAPVVSTKTGSSRDSEKGTGSTLVVKVVAAKSMTNTSARSISISDSSASNDKIRSDSKKDVVPRASVTGTVKPTSSLTSTAVPSDAMSGPSTMKSHCAALATSEISPSDSGKGRGSVKKVAARLSTNTANPIKAASSSTKTLQSADGSRNDADFLKARSGLNEDANVVVENQPTSSSKQVVPASSIPAAKKKCSATIVPIPSVLITSSKGSDITPASKMVAEQATKQQVQAGTFTGQSRITNPTKMRNVSTAVASKTSETLTGIGSVLNRLKQKYGDTDAKKRKRRERVDDDEDKTQVRSNKQKTTAKETTERDVNVLPKAESAPDSILDFQIATMTPEKCPRQSDPIRRSNSPVKPRKLNPIESALRRNRIVDMKVYSTLETVPSIPVSVVPPGEVSSDETKRVVVVATKTSSERSGSRRKNHWCDVGPRNTLQLVQCGSKQTKQFLWEVALVQHLNRSQNEIKFPEPFQVLVQQREHGREARVTMDLELAENVTILGTMEEVFELHLVFGLGMIPESVVAWLVMKMLKLVCSLHGQGVAHNSLGLSSFLVARREDEDEWMVYLMDLGFKGTICEKSTNASEAAEHYTHDRFSLAASLWSFLTGGSPFLFHRVDKKKIEVDCMRCLSTNNFLRGRDVWEELLLELVNPTLYSQGLHQISDATVRMVEDIVSMGGFKDSIDKGDRRHLMATTPVAVNAFLRYLFDAQTSSSHLEKADENLARSKISVDLGISPTELTLKLIVCNEIPKPVKNCDSPPQVGTAQSPVKKTPPSHVLGISSPPSVQLALTPTNLAASLSRVLEVEVPALPNFRNTGDVPMSSPQILKKNAPDSNKIGTTASFDTQVQESFVTVGPPLPPPQETRKVITNLATDASTSTKEVVSPRNDCIAASLKPEPNQRRAIGVEASSYGKVANLCDNDVIAAVTKLELGQSIEVVPTGITPRATNPDAGPSLKPEEAVAETPACAPSAAQVAASSKLELGKSKEVGSAQTMPWATNKDSSKPLSSAKTASDRGRGRNRLRSPPERVSVLETLDTSDADPTENESSRRRNPQRRSRSREKSKSQNPPLKRGLRRSTRAKLACGMVGCTHSFESGLMWVLMHNIEDRHRGKDLHLPTVPVDHVKHLICETCRPCKNVPLFAPRELWTRRERNQIKKFDKYLYYLCSKGDYESACEGNPNSTESTTI